METDCSRAAAYTSDRRSSLPLPSEPLIQASGSKAGRLQPDCTLHFPPLPQPPTCSKRVKSRRSERGSQESNCFAQSHQSKSLLTGQKGKDSRALSSRPALSFRRLPFITASRSDSCQGHRPVSETLKSLRNLLSTSSSSRPHTALACSS